jgi:hypothetical protein
MMLGPGSIESGAKRSALEKFDYAAGDLALCHRHEGEWVQRSVGRTCSRPFYKDCPTIHPEPKRARIELFTGVSILATSDYLRLGFARSVKAMLAPGQKRALAVGLVRESAA